MADLSILLIGNGGREHALAWKLSQSPRVSRILAVPGNGGTAACPKVSNVTSVSADDFPALVALARAEKIDLVVPGPEAPLVDGVEGFFRAAGIPVFGPSKEAARLEGSKTYSKDFMKKYNIPTAAYENFDDYDKAAAYIDSVGHDVVIKATGLAAGKGVIIPQTKKEAKAGLKEIMVDKAFGDAGSEVVIEELLLGDELSVLTFCDGYTIRSLPLAQDHKRIFDGDLGPNTGGMGCYAPTNIATKELTDRIDREVLEPTIAGMRREKQPFRGVLFTGLMITSAGPKVLEYNVRFGDPETQTVLPLLSADTDLAEVMLACAGGYLDNITLKIDETKFSATVVLAAGGYPGSYPKGTPMAVKEAPAGSTIFHAGTKLENGQLKTSGGRVIAINSVGDSLRSAVDASYAALSDGTIVFENMFYRKDIAYRAFRTTADKPAGMTYASAGVDIAAGNDFVEKIKKAVASTKRPGADAEIGGFGGEVDLSKAGFGPDAPVIVGAIDGVGTKLMIAQAMKRHDTVGIDLVAMNVNDLVVQGATPLMFLDYYGCSKLDLSTAASFVESVAEGCRQAGCALVGGETAEMPGMYQGDDYDAAGCAVGSVTEAVRLPRTDEMREGDVLLGLASAGVHSNGFSLVRRILAAANVSYTSPAPWDANASSAGASLLTPTRIYVRSLLPVLSQIKGLAHITGGGLVENVPRMLPPTLSASIDYGTWEVPPVFRWLKTAGRVEPKEMVRTFNAGVGMVVAVDASRADEVRGSLEASGERVFQIGKLVKSDGKAGCTVNGLDAWTD